jgi:Tol biopolymer transport system component
MLRRSIQCFAAIVGAALGLAPHGVLSQVKVAGEILFQSDREGPSRLFVLDLATRQQRRVGPAGAWFDEDPVWSPDGRRIAFASTRFQTNNIDIYVMDADGSNAVRLTDHPANDQDPDWAADGQSLFFTSERDGRGEVYRVMLSDRSLHRQTSGIDRAIMPAASRDGRTLAYAAQTLIQFQIKAIDLVTGKPRDIAASGGACRPAFSPDSSELAYVVLDREPSRIEAVRGSSRRTLVADPKLWSYYPAYSPDGRYVAFSVSPEHHRGEDWDLAIVDAAKPGPFERLTSGPGNDRVPQWRPAAR